MSSFLSCLNHWLILFLACVLFTTFNQSRLGPFEFCEVIISILSPFLITYSIGTNFPLTRAPTILFPTALCTLYAKSIGVEPFGRVLTSPAGVKQYTLSENKSRSFFNRLKNSLLSDISLCHSRIWRSQLIFSSSWRVVFSFPPLLETSLYFQWAAIPYSAVLCISNVRIWISNGCPFGPIKVVWSDWYIFGFGIAI